jgi:hypothetical protein
MTTTQHTIDAAIPYHGTALLARVVYQYEPDACEGMAYLGVKWCGQPARHSATKMCDGCWELDHRIRDQPELARRIFEHYHGEKNRQIDLFSVDGVVVRGYYSIH